MTWIAPRSGGYQGSGAGPSGAPPKTPPSASLVPRPDPGFQRVLATFGRLGVEMALPAPAEEVERNIRLGIDLGAGRPVTVTAEVRDGVVYLLASHELDR